MWRTQLILEVNHRRASGIRHCIGFSEFVSFMVKVTVIYCLKQDTFKSERSPGNNYAGTAGVE